MDTRRSNTAGMTLLELMFAAGIVATVLGMVFGSMLTMSKIGDLNESRVAAITALSSVLEEVNTLPFDQVLEYVPPELKVPGVGYEVMVELVPPGSHDGYDDGMSPGESYPSYPEQEEEGIPLPISSESQIQIPNPVGVRVTIYWQEESGHVFSVTARTLKEH